MAERREVFYGHLDQSTEVLVTVWHNPTKVELIHKVKSRDGWEPYTILNPIEEDE